MILFEPRPRPPKGSSFTTATSLIKLKRKESSNQSLGNRICPHLPLMYCLEKCTSLYQRRGGLDSDADANTGGRLCYIRTTILQIKNYDEFIRDSPTAPWAMRISSTRAFRKKRINRCSTYRRRKGKTTLPPFFFLFGCMQSSGQNLMPCRTSLREWHQRSPHQSFHELY